MTASSLVILSATRKKQYVRKNSKIFNERNGYMYLRVVICNAR